MAVPKGTRVGGRAKNTPNKITTDLKEMIQGALSDLGGRDYLVTQGRENPTAFLTLLGKVLPKDVNANVNLEGDIRSWLVECAKASGI